MPITEYCLGFMFDDYGRQVLLILKDEPNWQKNSYNGIGGKIELGEAPGRAMIREFHEEVRGNPFTQSWLPVVVMTFPEAIVHVFRAKTLKPLTKFTSRTDEKIKPFNVDELPPNILPDLRWLIPLTLKPTKEFSQPLRLNLEEMQRLLQGPKKQAKISVKNPSKYT